MCATYNKMLALAKDEAKHCDLEQVEYNIITRLAAAFILRGTPILVTPKLQVNYELILEWISFTVVTHQGTRSWGMPGDIQMLAHRLVFHYPLGVIVIHHELRIAFKFQVDEPPRIMELPRALHYASLFPGCLTLARFQMDDEKCAFAYVTVENSGPYVRVAQHPCPRDLLITSAFHTPDVRTRLGGQRSLASLPQSVSSRDNTQN